MRFEFVSQPLPTFITAIQLLESLETDPSVEVVLLTNSLYKLAFNLFKKREDQEWGLVDCIGVK